MFRLLIPLLKPLGRLFLGLLAIPLFRFLMRRVLRVQEIDEELEKDLEQWFKASLVLLAATANMEETLFGWVSPSPDPANLLVGQEDAPVDDTTVAWLVGMRLLLVIGVIESMPDQALFSIIHPGPPKLYFKKEKGLWCCAREQWFPFCKGFVCQHLSRSSPVFAILCAIVDGPVGWFCYGMAIGQYLIIGLVTSRDRALDVLSEFDKQIELRRQELIKEFDVQEKQATNSSQSPAEVSSSPEQAGLTLACAENAAGDTASSGAKQTAKAI